MTKRVYIETTIPSFYLTVNSLLGLPVPVLSTPLQLMEEDDDS
jgi:hypothetical protein